MGLKIKLILLVAFFCLALFGSADAKLRKSTYPLDISKLEWQLLNWNAVWRGTTTASAPFTLERMEYARKEKVIHVYLTGKLELGKEENYQKGVSKLVSIFRDNFSDFDEKTDLVVHFNLKSEQENKTSYKEYYAGTFSDQPSVSFNTETQATPY